MEEAKKIGFLERFVARLKEIVKRPKKETTTETIIQTSQSRTDSRPSFYSQPREKTPIEKTNESTPPIGVSPFPKPQAPKPKLALTLKKNHEFESAESAQKKPAEERISQPIFVQKKEPIPSGVFPTPEPPKETPVKEELEPLQETEPAEMKVQTETSTSKKPSARKYNKKVKPTRVSKAKKATRKKAKPKRISKAKKPSARKYNKKVKPGKKPKKTIRHVQKIITTTKYKPIFSDQRPVQKIRIPKPKTVLSKREIIQREILEEIKRRQVIELPSRETEPEIEEPKETPISPPTKKENKIRAQLKKERQLARKVEKIQLQEMEKEVVGMKPKNEKEQRPVSHPIRETKVVKRISVPSDPVHIRKEDIEELKKLIDHKSAGKVDPQQIKQLQSMIEELLQKNMLSRSEVEQNIRAIDANRVLEGFTKLVGLIQPATSSGTIRITPEKFEIPFSPMKKSKKPVGIEKELEKKELITDFDKILEIIRERGSIKLDELAKELKMDKRGVKEVVDILEESNLLIQEYSAFGPSHIVDLEYARTRKKKWGKK